MGKSQGAKNKTKGSNAERLYAQKFRELGYKLCQTARYASKLHDDAKIDLVHIPYNIQIKAGIQKGMNPAKELVLMEASVKSMFPSYDSVHNFPRLLIHHKQTGSGNKRTEEDVLVYMSSLQFEKYKTLNKDLVYLGIKVGKLQSTSEFKDIIWMTFKYFVDEIVIKTKDGDC